jgi:integrase
MCVFKQGEKWWYEFKFQGRPVRANSRSTDKAIAQLIESEHRRSLKFGTGGVPAQQAVQAKEKPLAQQQATIPADHAPQIVATPGMAESDQVPQAQVDAKQQLIQENPFSIEFTGSLAFDEAAALWLDTRIAAPREGHVSPRYIRRTTEKDFRGGLRTLGLFFSSRKLVDIKPRELSEYQRMRSRGEAPFMRPQRCHAKEVGPSPVGPRVVNKELDLLIRLLKRAGCWTHLFEHTYEKLLTKESELPRALTPEEQDRWLRTCMLQPRWSVVYWYSLLAFDTSMSTNELRALRLGDINLQQQVISVPPDGAKNRYRLRTIALISPEAQWAAEKLIERAQGLGANSPLHYLFPFRTCRNHFEPSLPMGQTGLRKACDEVRVAAKLPAFRPYDTRHTAITRMAEEGIRIAVIMKRAGHVSARMSDHYTHISEQAERREFDRVRNPQKPPPVSHMAPGVMHPDIQAEIDRRVVLALEGRRSTSRTPERPVRRRLIRRRRIAKTSTWESVGPIRRPSAPNVIPFPGAAQC